MFETRNVYKGHECLYWLFGRTNGITNGRNHVWKEEQEQEQLEMPVARRHLITGAQKVRFGYPKSCYPNIYSISMLSVDFWPLSLGLFKIRLYSNTFALLTSLDKTTSRCIALLRQNQTGMSAIFSLRTLEVCQQTQDRTCGRIP